MRGGAAAIAAAAAQLDLRRAAGGGEALAVAAIRDQLSALVERVASEGACWHPDLAALAIKQAQGDPLEAAFLVRAWRSTRPRLGETVAHDGGSMRLVRRISAAFKEIPGGQVLGPTTDYLQRLFRYDLLDEDPAAFQALTRQWLDLKPEQDAPADFPKVIATLRAEGLLPPVTPDPAPPFDITREALRFPAPRSASLATLARGEAGGILALAYSTMRGYGMMHPTVAELRVGWLPILLPHPVTGELVEAGEVPITECEIVATHGEDERGGKPRFTLGYGCCLGHQEVKAIAIAMLDRSLMHGVEHGISHPGEDPEFVLMHVDGIESMGFCAHYKLPHYVTFQADLDNLRKARRASASEAVTT